MATERKIDHDFGLPLFLADNMTVAFSTLDKDNKGYLDKQEVIHAIQTLLPHLDATAQTQIYEAILKEADTNNDGKIDFDEFISFVSKRKVELDKTVGAVRHAAETNGSPLCALIIRQCTPQTVSSMFYTYVGGSPIGDNDQGVISDTLLTAIVTDIFPDLPALCIKEIVDMAMKLHVEDPSQIDPAKFLAAVSFPFEQIRYQPKRLQPLRYRTASIYEMRRDDSVINNPLNHLTDAQVRLLATHLLRGPLKRVSAKSYFRDAVDIQYHLRECFDPVIDDELLEDITNILCNTHKHGGNYGVSEFMRALITVANQLQSEEQRLGDVVPIYSIGALNAAVKQVIVDNLNAEEVDLLRDTFIRLDSDGDGFVSHDHCAMIAEDVLEKKFSAFQPYLRALFTIADKDGDGQLNLGEFLQSFVDGPGVVPQEVITACVAPVRLRLSDDEISLVERTFFEMDLDKDKTLDFQELMVAIQSALKPQFPEITQKQYQDVVDVIFSKADRDLDGKLNLSEFTRSLQEEQGVIPIQLIEFFAKRPITPQRREPAEVKLEDNFTSAAAVPAAVASTTSLSATADASPQRTAPLVTLNESGSERHQQSFESALSFLSLDEIAIVNDTLIKFLSLPKEYYSEPVLREVLQSEFKSTSLSVDSQARIVDVLMEYSHRNHNNELSVTELIRRFSLGHMNKPKRHSTACDHGSSMGTHTVTASISKSSTDSEVLRVSQSTVAAAEKEEEDITASQQRHDAAEVYVPAAEVTILHRMFARFDTDRDGFLLITDISDIQSRLFRERNPDWSKEAIDAKVNALFSDADRDKDGRLSYDEFAESFREGSGVFPEDYVQALSEQILLDLSTVNLSAVWKSLQELDHQHSNGFPSQATLAEELERVVTPFVVDGNYVKIRMIVDYMLLFCPAMGADRTVSLQQLLRFIQCDLLGKAYEKESVEPQQSSPVTEANTLTIGEPDAEPQTTESITPAAVVEEPRPSETVVPLLDMSVAPYEFAEIGRVVLSISQATTTISVPELHSKLYNAMTELFLENQEEAGEAAKLLMRAAQPFVDAKSDIVDIQAYATVCVGTDVPPSALGFDVASKDERRAKAVEIVNAVLPIIQKRRALAEALLSVDTERTGEIRFDQLSSVLHEPLRDLSAKDYSRLVRALRLVGEKTILGTFSISEFLKPFATVYYVEPDVPLPTGGLLRRLSTFEEEQLLHVIKNLVFEFEDAGAAHEVNIAAVAKALGDALVASGFQDTVSIHDIRFISQLFGEVVVTGEHSLPTLQHDLSLVRLPWSLLPSRVRCEYALRKLRLEIGEATYLRKLCRVLLLTDRHRNGVFSHSVLSEALSSELRLLHRDWSAQTVAKSIEEWILAAEVDDKNYILFGKMMDTFLDIFPVMHPMLVGEILVRQPLEDPDALRAALHHLAEKGEVPAVQLKMFSSDGNGPVSSILNFFSAVGWIEARSSIDFGSVYPACRFHEHGMTVLLGGLTPELAQRSIFHVLPVTRQRDLACSFMVIDSKKDNVLDFEELEPILVHHERTQMKLRGIKGTTGVRSGRLVEIDLADKAKSVFTELDKLKLGLLTLEDFVASFARGILQYELLESILTVYSGGSSSGGAETSEHGATAANGTVHPRKPEGASARPHSIPNVSISDEELNSEFAKYDRNRNGYLSRTEFAEAYLKLEHFGLIPSRQEIDRLFGSICADKDKMSFDEFCVIMLRRSRM